MSLCFIAFAESVLLPDKTQAASAVENACFSQHDPA
jgi:hypothetical protein